MDNLRRYYESQLSGLYTRSEIAALFRTFASELTGMPPSATYFCKDSDFSSKQFTDMQTIAQKLAQGQPYQQILGWCDNGGRRWLVNADVLIPRPETAELIERIGASGLEPASILDLCTGSGFIAVSLALRYPKARVDAVDLSEAALQVARNNAGKHQADVEFWTDDVLHPSDRLTGNAYDLIVSNPPYVCDSEKAGMQPQVYAYEPAMALFVPDDDPLRFYRHIARLAACTLRPGGQLWLEINERFGWQTCSLLEDAGWEARLMQDLSGRDRFVSAARR
ncbi:MAG: peptide chain release factor N(5)-glutamine methyltransferase [Paludibacteraceae bacterium]|nr:peptide chain release factor N(5)-glutamine methyltransferase [Paludibacteraceae bacterium]